MRLISTRLAFLQGTGPISCKGEPHESRENGGTDNDGMVAGGGTAQEAKDIKKGDPAGKPGKSSVTAVKEGEVDIHFYNGSTVRMQIRSEKLDVATHFGKLQVPVKEIRSIEFGAHPPEAGQEQDPARHQGVGSMSFKERDEATNLLIELGPHSYAAVYAALQDADPEVSNRAKEIATKLQSAFPKGDLKTSFEDRIVTDGFTVVGEILTPSVKATAKYFGDVELSLSDMRTLPGRAAANQGIGGHRRCPQIFQRPAMDGDQVSQRRTIHAHDRCFGSDRSVAGTAGPILGRTGR